MDILHFRINRALVWNMTERNDVFSVHVIKTGEAEVPSPEVFWMQGWERWERLSFHALLVQNGRYNLLINTGLPDDLTERNRAMVDFAGERAMFKPFNILDSLKALGVKPTDIHGIAFTPLQDYATGGVEKFPAARIYLDRKGWIEDIVAPLHRKHLPRNLFIPEGALRHIMFTNWDRVVMFDGMSGYNILPGVRAEWVGCHHRSSLAFTITTEKGPVIFSDCSFKSRNIQERIPIGIAENTLECLDAYDRYSGAGIFLSAYDPEIDGLEF